MESKKLRLFNKLSLVTLSLTIFLSIFAFLPYSPLGLDSVKGFIISLGVILSFFFWLVARLIDGRFSIPKDRMIFFAFLIPGTSFLAYIFSSSHYSSLFGGGFTLGTTASMFVLFLALFLSSIYFQSERRIKLFLKLFFSGATILALFELVFIFLNFNKIFPGMLSGVQYANLFGTWNNFAMFFGSVVILSLLSIEIGTVKRFTKFKLSLLTILSLFFIVLVNSRLVWILVGIFTIIIFVYSVSSQQFSLRIGENPEKKLPLLSFVTILIAILFLFTSGSLGASLSNYFGVFSTEVRPSVTATFQIIKNALLYNPVFGTGPNTFLADWAMWKPQAITISQFWNYNFAFGSSFFLSSLATTGIVGFFALILMIVVFIFRGMQSIFIALRNAKANYFIFASFISAFYFWILIVLSVPNFTNTMFAFVFTGVFLGSLVHRKILENEDKSFLQDPRASFFSIFGLVILIIVSLIAMYTYISKFSGMLYVSNSQVTSNIDDLNKAERNLKRAVAFGKSDGYLRNLSEIYIAKFNVISSDNSISEDTKKVVLQDLVSQAEASALEATRLNSRYYLNWINLGNVYSFFTSAGVEGAYDNAINSYEKAQIFAPADPSILLAKAQLEINNKNNTRARSILNEALEIKPNYTDAIFLLAKIDTDEGKLGDAIKQAERAANVAQNDPAVFFNLGILRYNNNNFQGAISAFETAVNLSPSYLNARYFLGISYQKVGRVSDAKNQFELLSQVLPNDENIKKALKALSDGNSIPDSESDTALPLEEENQ